MKNRYAALLMLVTVTVGCSRAFGPKVLISPPAPSLANIRRVAIAPIENLSEEPNAGKRVTGIFLARYFNADITEVVEPSNVESFLLKARVRSFSELDTETIRSLGTELNVQALILGSLHEYQYRQGGNSQVPVVGLSIRVVDTRSGHILFALTHTREGDDNEKAFGYGRIESLTRMAQIVTAEVVNTLVEWAGKSKIERSRLGEAPTARVVTVITGSEDRSETHERELNEQPQEESAREQIRKNVRKALGKLK